MRILKHFLLFIAYGLLGTALALFVVYIVYLENRPNLKPWHLVRLKTEFHAGSKAESLDEYRRLEDVVFKELQKKVYERVESQDRRQLNRYAAGSLSDSSRYSHNWNRTYEFPAHEPRGGVVLLHGLSDSPYSLRAIGKRFNAAGFWVVGLRLPGHGTAPSGLIHATWKDWAAAARLATQHVRGKIGSKRPLYIAGYSAGAALAVEYALSRLGGERLPRVDRLLLFSPAIGLSPVASLASLQGRMAGIPGLDKLGWTSILPEYDPYKYTSFAVNGGDQIYLLTKAIEEKLSRLDDGNGVSGMPPIIAFQSVADDTITAKAIVTVLFQRLSAEGHELVAFDINRNAKAQPLLDPSIGAEVKSLLSGKSRSFGVTLLTNEDALSDMVIALHRRKLQSEITRESTGLHWPLGIFSLSHVALPFPPDDPIYGASRPNPQKTIYLGRPELLGERGLLLISANELVRLRFNPFFSYMERRLFEFVGIELDAGQENID